MSDAQTSAQDQPTSGGLTPEQAAQFLPEQLRRPPIFDLLSATDTGRRQLQLLRSRSARGATDSEVAQFLELCSQYGLDWNAHECWCAVSKPNEPANRRVLLMVGRNGLRKIAQRQGLEFDGDVVRAKDTFSVTRGADRQRHVEHSYTGGTGEQQRGAIVGAWCEVYERETGRQRGYFYAPLSEYLPTGAKLQYSPWGSQASTMILAAAERQALSQATPLGGLYAAGELDRVEDRPALGAGEGDGESRGWQGLSVEDAAAVEAVLERARDLGHVGLQQRAAAEVALNGQPAEFVAGWLERATAELDRMADAAAAAAAAEQDADAEPGSPEDVPDAVVVDEPPAEPVAPTPAEGEPERGRVARVEHAAALRARKAELEHQLAEVNEKTGGGPSDEAIVLGDELDAVDRELGAASDPGQSSLGL